FTIDSDAISLHDALPICDGIHVAGHLDPVTERMHDLESHSRLDQIHGDEHGGGARCLLRACRFPWISNPLALPRPQLSSPEVKRSEEHTSELQSRENLVY